MIIEEEKAYLKHVLEQIKKEIEKSENVLNELSKRGTSLSFEDRKRGDHFNINAQATNAYDRIETLIRSIPVPYFGRIDFSQSPSSPGQKIYIGRAGISSDYESLVTDWRAPISSLYYDSEIGPVSYDSPSGIVNGFLNLKRQINIKDSNLIDAQDTSLVTNDELLKPYLSLSADNKMKTIIASIQKEQNYIIRRPITSNIVVQGVAGSGKTSVALHRIAYLIYALKDSIKSTEFIVIGPNNYFLSYISSILPELETSPVDQKTYLDFLNEELNDKLTLVEDDPEISKEQAKICAFKTSLKYKEALDKFILNYLENDIVREGIFFDNEEVFAKEQILKLLFNGVSKYPNFDKACKYIVKKYKDNMRDIYEKLNKKYHKIYINLPMNDPKRNEAIAKSEELNDFIKNKGVKYIKDYFKKLNVRILDLYKVFVSNITLYVDDVDINISLFQKNTLSLLQKKKINFDDMAALMHLNFKLHGQKKSYRHIVVDEAQDYGMFHFSVLKEMFPTSTYSIYGDLAQSVCPYRSIKDWQLLKVLFNDNFEYINISKSYRTTTQITNNANHLLNYLNLPSAQAVVREGNDVLFTPKSKENNYKFQKIKNYLEQGYQTVAIICKTESEAKKIYNYLKEQDLAVTHITFKDHQYNGGVCVLTASLAKGLEFDTVIINDASLQIYDVNNDVDMHLLYVACTRALHELEVLYDKQLCPVFKQSEEDINIRKLTK